MPNQVYIYHPKYRAKFWDGKISYFDKANRLLPIGLLPNFFKFLKQFRYNAKFHFDISEISETIDKAELKQFYDLIFKDTKYYPRDYQDETIYKCLTNKRGTIESPTGSGKSLTIYTVIRYLLAHDIQTMLVVPSTSLVEQMYDDFKDYGWDSTAQFCNKLYSKQELNMKKPVLITTWQSVYKRFPEFFNRFGAVIVDECLHPDTLVTMSDNSKKKIKNVNIGDKIISYNIKTEKKEIDVVTKVFENMVKSTSEDMYELEMDNGNTIKITGNHKVLTNNGYCEVKNLKEDDEIIDVFMN